MDLNDILGRIRSIERQPLDPELELQGRILLRFFLTKSPLLVDELFPLLEELSKSADFERKWIQHYQEEVESEKATVLHDAAKYRAAGRDERFPLARLPMLAEKEAVSSFSSLRTYLESSASGANGTIDVFCNEYRHRNGGDDGKDYIVSHYFWFVLADVLYRRYVSSVATFEWFERRTASAVKLLYQQIGLNPEKYDQQFAKYGLLSCDENFRLLNSKEERVVVDGRLEVRFVVDVSGELMRTIEFAIRQGFVKQIAFRVVDVRQRALALEAVEYGSIFSFSALGLPRTTRLYEDANYENALWISVDKKKSSLTFEELIDDFSEFRDCVVTQVVHLELAHENGAYFISHIDHEYIMYSLLEYAERQRSADVKGFDKLKTFKIDGARIPWSNKVDGRYFLYTVLDTYFCRKALLREYFESVLAAESSEDC